MNLRELNGICLYIVESLPIGDMKTGSNLRDDLRQLWYDTKIKYFTCKIFSPYNIIDLENVMLQIKNQVVVENKIPIIQIECHGSSDGLMISSQERIPWFSLFDMLRPINESSHDLLMLHMSMCNGDAIIRAIDPQKRSPFRATIGHEGEAFPEDLIKRWLKLFSNYNKLFTEKNIGLHKLAIDCGFIYYTQEFIFDAHFDLANQDPELFEQLRMKEMYNMYKEDGPLAMHPEIYKKWVAQKQARIKQKYRDNFCFTDILKENLSIYLNQKE